MTSGLNPAKYSFSPKAFIEDNNLTFKYFQETNCPIFSNHPVNPIRLKAIEIFANSKLFKLFQSKGLVDFDDNALHEKIENEIIKLMLDLFESNLDHFFTTFMITSGIIIAQQDGEISNDEISKIIEGISPFILFPREYIFSMIENKNLEKVMQESIDGILSEAPELSSRLVDYLVSIVLADKHCTPEELATVIDISTRYIGLSEREAMRIIGNSIRYRFVPNV